VWYSRLESLFFLSRQMKGWWRSEYFSFFSFRSKRDMPHHERSICLVVLSRRKKREVEVEVGAGVHEAISEFQRDRTSAKVSGSRGCVEVRYSAVKEVRGSDDLVNSLAFCLRFLFRFLLL
jgi:hypothetical protein